MHKIVISSMEINAGVLSKYLNKYNKKKKCVVKNTIVLIYNVAFSYLVPIYISFNLFKHILIP